MEYLKQLIGLPIVVGVVLFLCRPSVLKNTGRYSRMRKQGTADAYFSSDYGRRMVRSLRLAGCFVLGYGLLQAPPIALPGSYSLAASLGAVLFVAAIPFPLRQAEPEAVRSGKAEGPSGSSQG